MARAWATSVEVGAARPGLGTRHGATDAHRPAPAGGPRRDSRPGRGRPRRAAAPEPPVAPLAPDDDRRPDGAATKARSGASESLVTSPAHTRSHSAVSTVGSS